MTSATRDPVKVAWVAGFLEGEGWFGKVGTQLRIDVKSTDRDVLVKLKEILNGVGSNVRQNSEAQGNCKAVYAYSLTGIRARVVMVAILPHMGERRGDKIRRLLGV